VTSEPLILSPGLVARIDQNEAWLDELVAAFRDDMAVRGQTQVMVGVAIAFRSAVDDGEFTSDHLIGLLSLAIKKLASQERASRG
jgi:hypothetical protein